MDNSTNQNLLYHVFISLIHINFIIKKKNITFLLWKKRLNVNYTFEEQKNVQTFFPLCLLYQENKVPLPVQIL